MNAGRVIVALAITIAVALTACARKPEPADLVLMDGAIYTLDAARPWVEAVAVREGRYVAVGSEKEIAAYVGAQTRVVDLQGRMAMPGINDAHVHPVMGGLKALFECNFGFTATPDDIAAAIRVCSEKNPHSTWLRGGQWGSSFFEQYDIASPREFLDALSPTHAIFLNDDSGHNGWVNTRALELAGIDSQTEDPPGGSIVRAPDGSPNGVLLENAARLFDGVIPPWTDDQLAAAAAESVRIVNAFGITGLKDAGALEPAGLGFSLVDKSAGLTVHAAVCMQTPYGHREEPLDYAEIEAARDRFASANVHTHFAKIFLDGVPTPARTAAMVHPYVADAAHGDAYTGALHIEPDLLAQDVVRLDALGFTVKMHAAGDRSVRVALDAIESARKANGDSGLYHEIAHAGYIDPADLPRFAQLNAVADFSPYLFGPSPIIQAVLSAVGDERGGRYWPTRALLASGASVLAGSDWPAAVASANPWYGIEAMVTRRDPDGTTAGTLWPDEAVTLAEALEIFTLGGARALRLDEHTGSVEAGKYADLIVIDRNLFEIEPSAIGDTAVDLTFFKGRLVHERN